MTQTKKITVAANIVLGVLLLLACIPVILAILFLLTGGVVFLIAVIGIFLLASAAGKISSRFSITSLIAKRTA